MCVCVFVSSADRHSEQEINQITFHLSLSVRLLLIFSSFPNKHTAVRKHCLNFNLHFGFNEAVHLHDSISEY